MLGPHMRAGSPEADAMRSRSVSQSWRFDAGFTFARKASTDALGCCVLLGLGAAMAGIVSQSGEGSRGASACGAGLGVAVAGFGFGRRRRGGGGGAGGGAGGASATTPASGGARARTCGGGGAGGGGDGDGVELRRRSTPPAERASAAR